MRSYNSHQMKRGVLALAVCLCAPPVICAQQMAVEFYHLDAQGNVLALTDWNGAVVESHDYDVFGQECTTGPCLSNPGAGAGQPRKFTGKERDTETGWDYFGARYYGSKIGRFTTTDPAYTIQENLVDPQRWNKYAYGRNNPLRYVDPDGKNWFPANGGWTWSPSTAGGFPHPGGGNRLCLHVPHHHGHPQYLAGDGQLPLLHRNGGQGSGVRGQEFVRWGTLPAHGPPITPRRGDQAGRPHPAHILQ